MLAVLLNWTKEHRGWLLALSVIVVFCTTYILILPALTLDEEKAAQQGGIDLVQEEQDAQTADQGNNQTQTEGQDSSNSNQDSDKGNRNNDDQNSDAEQQTQAPAAGPLAFEGDGFNVTANPDAKAGLPLDTELSVTPIEASDKDYEAYCDEALKAVQEAEGEDAAKELKFAYFYDISLMADGAPVEPESPVDIAISYDKAIKVSDAQNLRIVHFAANEDGSLKPEVLDPKDVALDLTAKAGDGGDSMLHEAAFAADSFSVYALVYTVDFEYTDEETGQTYQYSLGGGGRIRLSELAETLGICGTEYADGKAFAADVAEVAFSDDSLVKVTHTEPVLGVFGSEDWVLESLQPFDTEESLTITMKGGEVIYIKVTDDNSYSSDLGDFVSSVTINADKEDGKYVIKPGKTYGAHLSFKEDPDGKQFDENGHLEYTFPDGFTPAATSGTFTIIATSRGVEYPVEGNTYRVENGKLIIDINTNSPNYQYVESSSISTIDMNIEGVFDTNKTSITWSDTVSTDIKPDLDQGVSIEKSITSFDSATGVITYQLKVKSLNGTNSNIVVSDHMDGTAVAINQNVTLSGATMSSEGVTYTRLGWGENTVNGFSFTIPSMAAGAEATVTYTATIDKTKLIANGVNLYDDGQNHVNAKPDDPGKQDNDSAHLRNIITAPTLTKGAKVSDAVNGKRTITWTIEATSTEYFSLAGGTIIDTIQAASRSDMKYSGDGLTIVVTDENGSSQTRNVSWATVGVTDLNSNYSWTYNVPMGDTGNKTYLITYTTEVDVSDFAADTTLKNDVQDPYKKTTGTVVVGPDGEDKKANLDKQVGEVTIDDIEWSVDITVPTQGLNRAVLTDNLPTQGNGAYHDTLNGSVDDVQVSGLIEGQECAVKSYSNNQLVINFQKFVNGEWVDGLIGGDNPRTITVSFKTNNDQTWITAAETSTYLREHTNNVTFEANRQVLTDSATGTPMKSTFTKKTERTEAVTVDGVTLPIYYYTINLTGVTGPFDITDTFDPRLIPAEVSVYKDQGKVCGGDQYYQGKEGSAPATIESDTDGAMTLHVTDNSLAKNGPGYYSHYKIMYALRVKDAAALESLKAEAASEQGGKITLTNRAESPYGKDEAEVTFENNVLTKELLNNEALGESTNIGEFRITINPDGYDLDPDSDMITLTDSFSKTLSIDYNTIKVEPAEGATWYVSGNVATFTLPDETPIVITYKAKVIGNGDIHFSNTAEIKGQKATISDTKYVNADMGGTSGNFNIKILKHKRYDFTEVLGGAKFGLYTDSDGQPVKDKDGNPVTFTTDDNGTAYVEGNQSEEGWSIHAGRMYYLQELEAPEGYNLSTTQYKFQINSDNTPDYDNNIYFNGDTLHINNNAKGGLEIRKSVYGTELDDAQKNAIVFTVTKPDGTTVSKKYSEFTNGKWKLTDLPTGTYTVTETCGEVDGYTRTTSYNVDPNTSSLNDEETSGTGQSASVTITGPNVESSVSFVNRYTSSVDIEPETLQLKVMKKWFVGDEDKSLSDEFANESAEISLKRYRANVPQTILKFYRTINNIKQEIAGPVSIPAGAVVSFIPSSGANARPMEEGAYGMYNGEGYAGAKYANAGDVITFDFSEHANASVIEIWFDNDPGAVNVSYTGGVTVSDDSFTKDSTYTGETATITGGGSKIFNNLPLTEEVGGTTYVYRYYIEETAKDGFTTQYQVGSGEFVDSISAMDAVGTDGNATILVKNTKEAPQTGSLKITKVVQVDDQEPANDAEKGLVNGNYTFTVSSGNSIVKYVRITVANGAPESYKIADTEAGLETAESVTGTEAVVSDLAEGDYVITETAAQNGMTLKAAVRDDGNSEAVSADKKVTVHVTAGQNDPDNTSAAAATFTNNIETVTAKVVKVWDHTGNTGTQPTSLTVKLSNGDTRILNEGNNWTAEITDLPKNDHTTGDPIEYIWTEEDMPAGYYLSNIQETTEETTGVITTTLTNSFTTHYNPTTTITGKKVWEDGGEGRPDSITVNLFKDGGEDPYRTITVQAPTGEDANKDQWPFEFTNLPVFNDDGTVVQYTVQEELPEGYTEEYGIKVAFSQATYIAGDATGEIVNSGEGSQTVKVSDGFNLGYIVIRHGNDFVIWTPRTATSAEIAAIKEKVVALSDQFNGINTASGDSMKIVSGVPDTVDVGKKHAVSVYMQNGEVWMKFLNPNAWSDFAYGTIPYTYTQAGGAGGGTITNTKKNTDFEFNKKWIDISQQEIEWDQNIQVKVSRKKGDSNKDTSFSLVYDIPKETVNNASGGTAEFIANGGAETTPKLKLTITTESNTKKYKFAIENLPYSTEADGKYTYYVEETNAKLAGYLDPMYENTSAPTGTTFAYNKGTIKNQQEGGAALPSTGGPGTRIFYILGCMLIAGSGLLLLRKHRAGRAIS